MSRLRADVKKAWCQQLLLPREPTRTAGVGIVPSPRDRACVDFAYKLVGSLGEKGSAHTTLRENVSAARNSFTSGRKGVSTTQCSLAWVPGIIRPFEG